MAIQNVHIDVEGNLSRSVAVGEIVAYCARAQRRDMEGKGKKGLPFIEVSLNSEVFSGSERDVNGFQKAFLVVTSGDRGQREPYITLDTDMHGNPVITSTVFKPDNFGILKAYIPDTKANREFIVKSMAYDKHIYDSLKKKNPNTQADPFDGMFLVSDELKAELKPTAEKLRKARDAKDKKIKAEAVKQAEALESTLCDALKEKYKDGFRGVKEYQEMVMPVILATEKRLRKQYAQLEVSDEVAAQE